MTDYGEYIVSMYCAQSGVKCEEIVRCKECKHFSRGSAEGRKDDWCDKHEHIGWSVNGFCAWGERRDA